MDNTGISKEFYALALYPNINSLKKFDSLYINNDFIENKTSYKEIEKYLSRLYSSLIANQKYSKNMTTETWGNFSEEDISRICKIQLH